MAHPCFTAPRDEPALPRAARRASGVYYTPPEIVRVLVAKTLGSANGQPLRVLDPACGAGAMLAQARRPGVSLFGVDCDPAAIAAARSGLCSSSARDTTELWTADALFDQRLDALAPFDAIVANPPYVNIRQLAKCRTPEYIERLRQRYRTARGNFDLYVLFLERAWQLLKEGGRCGMIVPNKWATLDYARPLRALLLAETTIEHVVDLSGLRVFEGASVYPQIVVFSKSRPSRGHRVAATSWKRRSSCPTAIRPVNRIPQQTLTAEAISVVSSIDVESRVATRPLGELCTLSCGTAGYSAQRIADALQERLATPDLAALPSADFITSGNIDRYAIRRGNVRFLGRTYQHPVVPLDAPGVTRRQRRLFAGRKIVIAGLSQRLEAAWDARGLALGVQVFAASEPRVDPHYLLALLNSKLLTYLFRTRFAAKRLAGGYVAINKGQLARLPIVVERQGVGSLWRAQNSPCGQRFFSAKDSRPRDAQIDRRVYRLYRLTKAEIAAVEAHFAELGRRAA